MGTDRTSQRAGAVAKAGQGVADGGVGRAGPAATAGLRIARAGLLIAAAAIHLDLYLTGYRSVPVIGGLFLFQVIAGFAAGAVVLVTGSQVAAAAGAAFALATLGGYLLSVWAGLFGFIEVSTTAGIAAGVIEVAAIPFAALALLAAHPRPSRRPSRPGALPGLAAAWLDAGAPGAVAAIGGVSAVALVLLGVAVAGAGGPAGPPAGPSAAAVLKKATINGATVLTNSKGLSLYWFAPDTPARSACTGVCAQYWPPVTGAAAGPGITGRLGTITRPDGSKQATYDGHPLYTYIADTAPGQAHGNNINLNGGVWHEVTVPG